MLLRALLTLALLLAGIVSPRAAIVDNAIENNDRYGVWIDGSGTFEVTSPGRVACVMTPSGRVCGMPIGTPK